MFGAVGHPRLLAAGPAAGVAGDAASGWSGRTGRWRRFSPRATRRACAGRSSTAPGATSSASGRRREEAWDMLQFALRLGRAAAGGGDDDAARNAAAARRCSTAPGTVVTRAPTAANRMHLAHELPRGGDGAATAGRALGRQELDGEFVIDARRARSGRGRCWRRRGRRGPLELDRVVVAIDPPVTERRAAPTSAASSSPGSRMARAAAGLGGRGDRRRQRRRALAAAAGPSGRWRSTTRTAPTGWWPR